MIKKHSLICWIILTMYIGSIQPMWGNKGWKKGIPYTVLSTVLAVNIYNFADRFVKGKKFTIKEVDIETGIYCSAFPLLTYVVIKKTALNDFLSPTKIGLVTLTFPFIVMSASEFFPDEDNERGDFKKRSLKYALMTGSSIAFASIVSKLNLI